MQIGLLIFCIFTAQTAAQIKSQMRTDEKSLPNLILNTIDGEKWSLYENRGRIVLINFWATWCDPCRTETPMLVKLGGEYKPRGLEIVGIALDKNAGLIKKFAAEYKIDYPILLPVPGSALSRIDPLPTTLLIDSEARLVKKYIGELPEKLLREDIENLIEELNYKPGATR